MNSTVAAALAADLAALVPSGDVALDAELGYGTDLSCVADLTETMEVVDPESTRGIAEGVVRRFITPRGALLDDPDYGFDLRARLNIGMTVAELRALSSQMRLEARKDDRLADAAFTVTYDDTTLRCVGRLTAESIELGSFELTFALTFATLTQLEVR